MSSSVGESVHVRVMVRVRPFNKREISLHQQALANNKQQHNNPPSIIMPQFGNNIIHFANNESGSITPPPEKLSQENSNSNNVLSKNASFSRTGTPPIIESLSTSQQQQQQQQQTSSSFFPVMSSSSTTQQNNQNAIPSIVCVGENETIHLLEPEREWSEREAFRFDKVFWSVPIDQTIPPPGPSAALFAPPQKPHTQQDVFEEVGKPAVESTMKGIHVTLMAYGQTGSGKTHSMLGSAGEEHEGVAPRMVRALFQEIEKKKKSEGNDAYQVTIELGFLEIYNEKVRDLLSAEASNNNSNGNNKDREGNYSQCRVRQVPGKGTFVEGLQRKLITGADECLQAITAGMSQRAVAATALNATSSRSHGIFQLVVTQRFAGVTRTALVNLVDLAGSERVKQSQVTGAALTEAAMINKSLSTLRRVIDVLIDNSNLKKGKTPAMPPFRESLLTWVLSDSLGGNSKTVMIAAVSPHHANAEDTLSTLRYALKAKAIVCTAKVNEEKTSAIISSLKGEIDLLKQQLEENASSSLSEELAARQEAIFSMEERAKKFEERHAAMDEELERRKAEIEAAQAEIQDMETVAAEKQEEEEKLMKFRADLMKSEQLFEQESASRVRAEQNLERARQQRKQAEEWHQKANEEISKAQRESNDMRVRQLLTTFQAAFVRMMKGQDLDQLRQERTKSFAELVDAEGKLNSANEKLEMLKERRKQNNQLLNEIRIKIDKTAHSDMLSESPLQDRRIVDARRKRQLADDNLTSALDKLEKAREELTSIKADKQERKTGIRVDRAKLLTEIAEIERQRGHLNRRIQSHSQIIHEHQNAENMYREKEQRHLEELAQVEENNERRSSNIAALKEALQRERANGDDMEDERMRKEREYQMLSDLLERLQQNLVDAREENDMLKHKMNEMFLPPSARNTHGAHFAAFRRCGTGASGGGGVVSVTPTGEFDPESAEDPGGPSATDAEEEELSEEEQLLLLLQQQQQQQRQHIATGNRKSPIPWRGTSFARTLTSSSTFSNASHFKTREEKLRLAQEEELREMEKYHHSHRSSPFFAGSELRSGGVHYHPPISGRKMSVSESTSPRVAHTIYIGQHGRDEFLQKKPHDILVNQQQFPTSSSASPQHTASISRQVSNYSSRPTQTRTTTRAKTPSQQNKSSTPRPGCISVGVIYQNPEEFAKHASTPKSKSFAVVATSTNGNVVVRGNVHTKTHHEKIRDQLTNFKPVFSSRGDSLVASGSLCVSVLSVDPHPSMSLLSPESEKQAAHEDDGDEQENILSPSTTTNKSGRGGVQVLPRAASSSLSRPRLGRPRPAFR